MNFLQAWAARHDRYSPSELAERLLVTPAEFESAMRGQEVSAGVKAILANRFGRTFAELAFDRQATLRAKKDAEKARNSQRPTAAMQHG